MTTTEYRVPNRTITEIGSGEVSIQIFNGNVSPSHGADVDEVTLRSVMITEQGTDGGLPIVDLRCTNSDGEAVDLTLTGRQILAIGDVIREINTRIHGDARP